MAYRSPKKEVLRVKRAVNHIIKKLDVKYVVQVFPIAEKSGEELTADSENDQDAILQVCRSNRDKQDKNVFLVFVNVKHINALNRKQVLRHVFHEICHIITWEYTDMIETCLKHVKAGPLKEQLLDDMYNIRENVTYNLERTMGPHVLPQLDWNEP